MLLHPTFRNSKTLSVSKISIEYLFINSKSYNFAVMRINFPCTVLYSEWYWATSLIRTKSFIIKLWRVGLTGLLTRSGKQFGYENQSIMNWLIIRKYSTSATTLLPLSSNVKLNLLISSSWGFKRLFARHFEGGKTNKQTETVVTGWDSHKQ